MPTDSIRKAQFNFYRNSDKTFTVAMKFKDTGGVREKVLTRKQLFRRVFLNEIQNSLRNHGEEIVYSD